LTPLRVPVEIAARDMRVWRLSESIDPGAIRFARDVPLERGTHVRLTFALPGGAELKLDGEVGSAEEIRFAAPPEERRAIEAYLEEQANQP
jgi:hypothetical protein